MMKTRWEDNEVHLLYMKERKVKKNTRKFYLLHFTRIFPTDFDRFLK